MEFVWFQLFYIFTVMWSLTNNLNSGKSSNDRWTFIDGNVCHEEWNEWNTLPDDACGCSLSDCFNFFSTCCQYFFRFHSTRCFGRSTELFTLNHVLFISCFFLMRYDRFVVVFVLFYSLMIDVCCNYNYWNAKTTKTKRYVYVILFYEPLKICIALTNHIGITCNQTIFMRTVLLEFVWTI